MKISDSTNAKNSIYLEKKSNNIKPGFGLARGSFGELLQGALPGQDNQFLITMPIQCYSRATFYPNNSGALTIYPITKTKSFSMAEKLIKYLNLKMGGEIIIESDLLEGKGLSSSSADIVATARAIFSSINKPVSNELILKILREIEPSDGVMYNDYVFFYHQKVELGKHLGYLPELKIIGIDEGTSIDTIEFNKIKTDYANSQKETYRKFLDMAIDSFKKRNLEAIGKIATQSAILNQDYNYKNFLDLVIGINSKVDGLGVVVAHSGSCLGVLLAAKDPDLMKKERFVIQSLKKISCNILSYQTISNH